MVLVFAISYSWNELGKIRPGPSLGHDIFHFDQSAYPPPPLWLYVLSSVLCLSCFVSSSGYPARASCIALLLPLLRVFGDTSFRLRKPWKAFSRCICPALGLPSLTSSSTWGTLSLCLW